MRKVLVLAALSGLAACSSAPQKTAVTMAPTVMQTAQVANQATAPVAPVSAIPDWVTDVPKSDDYIYAVGDGMSGSVSGALGNARTNAYEGICQASGGTVRSQSKAYRNDTESESTRSNVTVIRNFCADTSVAGASVVKSKILVENNRYHAYVLVALPLGDKNVVTRADRARAASAETKSNATKEFKEMDEVVDKHLQKKNQTNSDSGVQTKSEADQPETLKLMDVDNAEYKRRRDEALQKPGAVVGTVTLR